MKKLITLMMLIAGIGYGATETSKWSFVRSDGTQTVYMTEGATNVIANNNQVITNIVIIPTTNFVFAVTNQIGYLQVQTNEASAGGSTTNLNAPYFTLTKGGTNQTIAASAFTLVTWNNAMVDHLNVWTPASNGVTLNAAGNYQFTVSCKGVGNQGIVGMLYKNGYGFILGDQSFSYDIGLAATYYPFSLTTPILACASGDVFQVYISYYSGNYVVQGSITNTWFSGWKVN